MPQHYEKMLNLFYQATITKKLGDEVEAESLWAQAENIKVELADFYQRNK